MQHYQGSSLSRTVGYFAHTLAGIGVFLLVPLIEQKLRPLIFDYFFQSFPGDVSLWCSWGFVVVVILSAFFGASSLFQVAIQLLLRRSVTRSGF